MLVFSPFILPPRRLMGVRRPLTFLADLPPPHLHPIALEIHTYLSPSSGVQWTFMAPSRQPTPSTLSLSHPPHLTPGMDISFHIRPTRPPYPHHIHVLAVCRRLIDLGISHAPVPYPWPTSLSPKPSPLACRPPPVALSPFIYVVPPLTYYRLARVSSPSSEPRHHTYQHHRHPSPSTMAVRRPPPGLASLDSSPPELRHRYHHPHRIGSHLTFLCSYLAYRYLLQPVAPTVLRISSNANPRARRPVPSKKPSLTLQTARAAS